MVAPAPAAQAHAFLAASYPTDGQVLAEAPTQLRLDFSESVVLGATRIDIVDGSGRHLTPTGLKAVSHGEAGQIERPVEVVGELPTLARSSYRVSWETISSDDLHSTNGVLVFGVGQSVTAIGINEPSPSPVEAGLRWLLFLGLSGALGGALATRLLRRAGGPNADRAAVLAGKISTRGTIGGAGVALVLLVAQLATSGAGVRELLWSSYGARWGLREVGLLLLAFASTTNAWTLQARAKRVLLTAGAALACTGTALLGHSGAGAPNLTRIIASAAHLAAAATWAGCLAVLVVVLVVDLRGAQSRNFRRRVLREFGPTAGACVSVMVVSGIYLSSKVVGSIDALLLTTYGRTLLLKVLLVGVAGSLALVNTLRLHRRGDDRPSPRRTVIAEAVAAVGILALAGVLTSAQPAMEPELVQATTQASRLVDGPVADLQESVSISPNRPGASVVLVNVFDTRRPSPGPVREVLVSIPGPSGRGAPQPAEQLSKGRWSLATQLTEAGPIQVSVVVRRVGLPDATRSFDWTIGGEQVQTGAEVVSTAPIGNSLQLIAGVLLGMTLITFMGATCLLLLRRRWRRTGLVPGGLASFAQVYEEEFTAEDRANERATPRVGVLGRSLR